MRRESPFLLAMREWFKHLKVAQKLMLISIFFVMPDSVMLFLFITAINDSIHFAEMEQKGNQYQRPLEELLELIPQHGELTQRTPGAEPNLQEAIAKKAADIDAAFYELEKVNSRLGVELQFTDEGLAKRHRERYRVENLKAEWKELKSPPGSTNSAEREEKYMHLIADVRTMITHAGDTSNLILDPDLDSYYLMDATLLALPQTQDRIAAVMAHGAAVLKQSNVTFQDRQQFAIYATMLKEADLDRVTGSVETALLEDPNFYGVSPSLQANVPPALQEYKAATEVFIHLTKHFFTLEKVDVTPEEYFAAGTKARDASFNLWRIADAEVDTLLQKRIEAYQARRTRSLLVAAGALLAAICFVTFITRTISGPLRQQAADIQTVNESLKAEIAERKRAENELRHSEAQLAAAQKIASIGSWDWDIASNAMSWSDEHYRIHGLEPHGVEASFEAALQFVHPEDRARSEAQFKNALLDKKPFSFEQRIIWKNGEQRMLLQRGDVVLNANGSVATIFGTAQDITERKRAEEELERVHNELLEVSRHAGMAEVATGVLHNVGNVLNSVNVSAMLISDRLSKSRIAHLSNVSSMIQENSSDLAGFFKNNPKGQKLPGFISSLAERLGVEQADLLGEVEVLAKNIAHIKDIVAVQQCYAKVAGVVESLPPAGLVEDALQMNGAAFERHGVEVVREFANTPLVRIEKHKVLQILINVLRNAKYAVSESSRVQKRITVSVGINGNNRVKIKVADNGVGIPAENLTRIFAHGFTTKRDGHGFGLHSAALAATEMGGSLIAQSAGLDQGASFTLELPIDRQASS